MSGKGESEWMKWNMEIEWKVDMKKVKHEYIFSFPFTILPPFFYVRTIWLVPYCQIYFVRRRELHDQNEAALNYQMRE